MAILEALEQWTIIAGLGADQVRKAPYGFRSGLGAAEGYWKRNAFPFAHEHKRSLTT